MMDAENSLQMTPKPHVKAPSVIDLAVRTLLLFDQHEIKLFGKPIYTVRLVGILRQLQVGPTEVTCFIEDHSGRIKARYTPDPDEDDNEMFSDVKQDSYVEVFGSFRLEAGEKLVSIIKIKPVDNANVIVCHLLKFISTRLEFEKDFRTKVYSANSAGAALADALSSQPQGTNSELGARFSTLSALQQEIYEIVKSEYSSIGISTNGVLMQFPAYQGPEILQTLDFLNNEGFIYPTIDSEHFMAVTGI